MNRFTKTLVAAFSLILVVNLIMTGYLFFAYSSVQDDVDQLNKDTEHLSDYLLQSGEGVNETSGNGTGELMGRQSGYFVAYDAEISSGVAFQYQYQPLPSDTLYIDASGVTIEGSFQESLRNAQSAVRSSGYNPQVYGAAFSLSAPEEWEYLRGESAGLAIAAQMAATDPDYRLDDGVVLTGQVEPNGNVVSVEHVTAKAEAARDQGMTTLIAPYTPTEVEVEGIEVIHVQSVDEALDHALVPVDDNGSGS